MEILKRYIRKENPHMEYMCNCAKTMADLDFNRHFNHDYKVSLIYYEMKHDYNYTM